MLNAVLFSLFFCNFIGASFSFILKNLLVNPSDKTMVRLYQYLGKIFYSVAAVDKTVRTEEIAQLKKIIQKEWLPHENTFDEFGSDSAYQIEIVFDWLVENEWNFEQTLSDFKIFHREHLSLFTPQLNALILKTTTAIATSFSGQNKSEQVFTSLLSAILAESY
jgi:hypothetical protein